MEGPPFAQAIQPIINHHDASFTFLIGSTPIGQVFVSLPVAKKLALILRKGLKDYEEINQPITFTQDDWNGIGLAPEDW